MPPWPSSRDELIDAQRMLAAEQPPLVRLAAAPRIGGCFICCARGGTGRGARGDRVWAAAALAGTTVALEGEAGAPYEPGLLALREGPLLEAAVRALPEPPDLLLVAATGRDHPRRAGLALHLGVVLGLPTVGVTHRPLLAEGPWPPDEPGARRPLLLEGDPVGCWLRTRRARRPLAVHAAWCTDADTAAEAVLATLRRARTPEPLRLARRAARTARSAAGGR